MKKRFALFVILIVSCLSITLFGCSDPLSKVKIGLDASSVSMTLSDIDEENIRTVEATVSNAPKNISTALVAYATDSSVINILETNYDIKSNKTTVKFQALKGGDSAITFRSDTGKRADVLVSVYEPLKSLSFSSKYKGVIVKGRQFKVAANELIFNSPSVSDKSVTYSVTDLNGNAISGVNVSSNGEIAAEDTLKLSTYNSINLIATHKEINPETGANFFAFTTLKVLNPIEQENIAIRDADSDVVLDKIYLASSGQVNDNGSQSFKVYIKGNAIYGLPSEEFTVDIIAGDGIELFPKSNTAPNYTGVYTVSHTLQNVDTYIDIYVSYKNNESYYTEVKRIAVEVAQEPEDITLNGVKLEDGSNSFPLNIYTDETRILNFEIIPKSVKDNIIYLELAVEEVANYIILDANGVNIKFIAKDTTDKRFRAGYLYAEIRSGDALTIQALPSSKEVRVLNAFSGKNTDIRMAVELRRQILLNSVQITENNVEISNLTIKKGQTKTLGFSYSPENAFINELQFIPSNNNLKISNLDLLNKTFDVTAIESGKTNIKIINGERVISENGLLVTIFVPILDENMDITIHGETPAENLKIGSINYNNQNGSVDTYWIKNFTQGTGNPRFTINFNPSNATIFGDITFNYSSSIDIGFRLNYLGNYTYEIVIPNGTFVDATTIINFIINYYNENGEIKTYNLPLTVKNYNEIEYGNIYFSDLNDNINNAINYATLYDYKTTGANALEKSVKNLNLHMYPSAYEQSAGYKIPDQVQINFTTNQPNYVSIKQDPTNSNIVSILVGSLPAATNLLPVSITATIKELYNTYTKTFNIDIIKDKTITNYEFVDVLHDKSISSGDDKFIELQIDEKYTLNTLNTPDVTMDYFIVEEMNNGNFLNVNGNVITALKAGMSSVKVYPKTNIELSVGTWLDNPLNPINPFTIIKDEYKILKVIVADGNTIPFSVSSQSDLMKIGDNDNKYLNYRLINDIILNDNFKCINEYYGTLYGNGFSIHGLTITANQTNAFGLFKVNFGEIDNLNIVNAKLNILAGNYKVKAGIIAGINKGRIINCTVNGEISFSTNKTDVSIIGGLVGENINVISNCNSNVTLTDVGVVPSATVLSNLIFGGMAGLNFGIISGTISDTTSDINVDKDYDTQNINSIKNKNNIAVKVLNTNLDTKSMFGGIAGANFAIIRKMIVLLTVDHQNAQGIIGGIAGYNVLDDNVYNTETNISDTAYLIQNIAMVSNNAKASIAGGVAGVNQNAKILNSTAWYLENNSKGIWAETAGGIVGKIIDILNDNVVATQNQIDESAAISTLNNVVVKGQNVGAIVGETNLTIINKSFAEINISGTDVIGGIAAIVSGSAPFTTNFINSYFAGDIVNSTNNAFFGSVESAINVKNVFTFSLSINEFIKNTSIASSEIVTSGVYYLDAVHNESNTNMVGLTADEFIVASSFVGFDFTGSSEVIVDGEVVTPAVAPTWVMQANIQWPRILINDNAYSVPSIPVRIDAHMNIISINNTRIELFGTAGMETSALIFVDKVNGIYSFPQINLDDFVDFVVYDVSNNPIINVPVEFSVDQNASIARNILSINAFGEFNLFISSTYNSSIFAKLTFVIKENVEANVFTDNTSNFVLTELVTMPNTNVEFFVKSNYDLDLNFSYGSIVKVIGGNVANSISYVQTSGGNGKTEVLISLTKNFTINSITKNLNFGSLVFSVQTKYNLLSMSSAISGKTQVSKQENVNFIVTLETEELLANGATADEIKDLIDRETPSINYEIEGFDENLFPSAQFILSNVSTTEVVSTSGKTITRIDYFFNMSFSNLERQVKQDLNYTIKIKSAMYGSGANFGNNLTSTLNVTLISKNIDNITAGHYISGNMAEDGSITLNEELSDIIVPSKQGVLQLTVNPYFADFDYLTIENDANNEAKLYLDQYVNNADRYVYHKDLYDKKLNKYTSIDNFGRFSFDGRLFIKTGLSALAAKTLPSGTRLSVVINAYRIVDGIDVQLPITLKYTLVLEKVPTVDISYAGGKYVAKGVRSYIDVTLGPNVKDVLFTSDDAVSIDSVSEPGKYVMYVSENVQSGKEFTINATTTKVINGILETSTTSLKLVAADFVIKDFSVAAQSTSYPRNREIPLKYNIDFEYNKNSPNIEAIKAIINNYSHELETAKFDNTDSSYVKYYINGELVQAANHNYDGIKIVERKESSAPNAEKVYNAIRAVNNNGEYNVETIFRTRYEAVGYGPVVLHCCPTLVPVNATDEDGRLNLLEFSTLYKFSYYNVNSEDEPTPIYTEEDLRNMKADNNGTLYDYRLMNDITLTNFEPLDVEFSSFDGNGYKININSFNIPAPSESNTKTLNLGFFKEVKKGSLVKNVIITLNALYLNVKGYTAVNIGFVTPLNNGDITNCEVLAYPNTNTEAFGKNVGAAGYTTTVRVEGDSSSKVSFGGLVCNNVGNITNSRVGRKANSEYPYIGFVLNQNALIDSDGNKIEISDENDNFKNPTRRFVEKGNGFVIYSVGRIGGFVCENSGNVTNSYIANSEIENITEGNKNYATTGGFINYNRGIIQLCFVEGQASEEYASGEIKSDSATGEIDPQSLQLTVGGITSKGNIGGFVYSNSNIGNISNSYANIKLFTHASTGGFVFEAENNSQISLSYSFCSIEKLDGATNNNRPFIASNDLIENNFIGTYNNCFYLKTSRDIKIDNYPVLPMTGLQAIRQNSYSGYNFADTGNDNGAWKMTTKGPSLITANEIIVESYDLDFDEDANNGTEKTGAYTYIERTAGLGYSYATLIRNAVQFNQKIIESADLNKVVGIDKRFRIVSNIGFESSEAILFNTNNLIFMGNLEGNGMTIYSAKISRTGDVDRDSVGLFKAIVGQGTINDKGLVTNVGFGGVVKNLNIKYNEFNAGDYFAVGGLAGIVDNGSVFNVNISAVDTIDTSSIVQINGRTIVGGVFGVLAGNSKISSVTSTIGAAADQINPSVVTNGEIEIYKGFNTQINGVTSYVKPFAYVDKSTGKFVTNISKANYEGSLIGPSYVGGVAGIVDLNLNTDEDASVNKDESTANLRMIKAGDNKMLLNGTVAGGLFGYLGNESYVHDAQILVGPALYSDDSGMNQRITGTYAIGGIAGINAGRINFAKAQYLSQDLLINNLFATSDNGAYVGLNSASGAFNLFGFNNSDKIKKVYAGGIAGIIIGQELSTTTTEAPMYRSGIVSNSVSYLNVMGLFNDGTTIISPNDNQVCYAGGIAGKISGGLIEYVYTTGSVIANYSGGLFGYAEKGEVYTGSTQSKVTLSNVVGGTIYVLNGHPGAPSTANNAFTGEWLNPALSETDDNFVTYHLASFVSSTPYDSTDINNETNVASIFNILSNVTVVSAVKNGNTIKEIKPLRNTFKGEDLKGIITEIATEKVDFSYLFIKSQQNAFTSFSSPEGTTSNIAKATWETFGESEKKLPTATFGISDQTILIERESDLLNITEWQRTFIIKPASADYVLDLTKAPYKNVKIKNIGRKLTGLFSGVVNENGIKPTIRYSLSNLENGASFFDVIEGGSVSNINFDFVGGGNITLSEAKSENVGLIGKQAINAIITNVNVKSSPIQYIYVENPAASTSGVAVGGVIGQSIGSIFTNVNVTNLNLVQKYSLQVQSTTGEVTTIIPVDTAIGGIVGIDAKLENGIVSAGNSRFENCSVYSLELKINNWSFTTDNLGTINAGGIIGYGEGSTIVNTSAKEYNIHNAHIITNCATLDNELIKPQIKLGGLIGTIKNGTVRDQIIENIKVNVTSPAVNTELSNVGLVLGYSEDTVIDNCKLTTRKIAGGTNEITGAIYSPNTSNNMQIGGFAGKIVNINSNFKVTNCLVEIPELQVNFSILGGFVGAASGVTFENCNVEGLQNDSVLRSNKFGGFVGIVSGNSKFTNCIVKIRENITHGIISANEIYGGFVAECSAGEFFGCYTELVTYFTPMNEAYAGGFVGKSVGANFTECGDKTTINITGGSTQNNAVGGFVGYSSTSNFKKCFAIGKFELIGVAEAVGGFIGTAVSLTNTKSTFTDCYTSQTFGKIKLNIAGGFAGNVNNADFKNIYVQCGNFLTNPNVSANNENANYFIGNITGNISLQNVYYPTEFNLSTKKVGNISNGINIDDSLVYSVPISSMLNSSTYNGFEIGSEYLKRTWLTDFYQSGAGTKSCMPILMTENIELLNVQKTNGKVVATSIYSAEDFAKININPNDFYIQRTDYLRIENPITTAFGGIYVGSHQPIKIPNTSTYEYLFNEFSGVMIGTKFEVNNTQLKSIFKTINNATLTDISTDVTVERETGLASTINNSNLKNIVILSSADDAFLTGSGIAFDIYDGTLTNCVNKVPLKLKVTNDCGGIAGRSSNTIFNNCYNEAPIESALYRQNSVGGLVGYYSSNVKRNNFIDCYNLGDFGSIQSYYVGGLVGQLFTATMQNCFNEGEINGLNNVGGLIGYSLNSFVYNCYNSGKVNLVETNTTLDYVNAGGLIGWANQILIDTSYNSGNIEVSRVSKSVNSVGGIIGQFSTNIGSGLTLNNVYNIGQIKDFVVYKLYAGGLLGYINGTLNTSSVTSCYTSSSISTTRNLSTVNGVVGYSSSGWNCINKWDVYFNSDAFAKSNNQSMPNDITQKGFSTYYFTNDTSKISTIVNNPTYLTTSSSSKNIYFPLLKNVGVKLKQFITDTNGFIINETSINSTGETENDVFVFTGGQAYGVGANTINITEQNLNEMSNSDKSFILKGGLNNPKQVTGKFKGILWGNSVIHTGYSSTFYSRTNLTIPLFDTIENAHVLGFAATAEIISGRGTLANTAINSVISTCDIKASIKTIGEKPKEDGTFISAIGGLVGESAGSIINSCQIITDEGIECLYTGTENVYIGGIVGLIISTSNNYETTIILSCAVVTDIVNNSNGTSYIGGVAGYADSKADYIANNTYCDSNIIKKGSSAGLSNATISGGASENNVVTYSNVPGGYRIANRSDFTKSSIINNSNTASGLGLGDAEHFLTNSSGFPYLIALPKIESKVIFLSSYEDVNVTLRNRINSGNKNLFIELCNDISLGPSFTSSLPPLDYNATFNGNGFAFNNLIVPLFSSVANSNFYNLIINANIVGEWKFEGRLGAVAFDVPTTSEFLNFDHVGVAGYISSSGDDIGGFLGKYEGNSITFKYCYNNADLSFTRGEVTCSLGGFIGYTGGSSNTPILFNNCYNAGNIYGTPNFAAGYVAYQTSPKKFTFEYCYNVGKIKIPNGGDSNSHFVTGPSSIGSTYYFNGCFYNLEATMPTTINMGSTTAVTNVSGYTIANIAQGNASYANSLDNIYWQKPSYGSTETYLPHLMGPNQNVSSSFYKAQLVSRMLCYRVSSNSEWNVMKNDLNDKGESSKYIESNIYLKSNLTNFSAYEQIRYFKGTLNGLDYTITGSYTIFNEIYNACIINLNCNLSINSSQTAAAITLQMLDSRIAYIGVTGIITASNDAGGIVAQVYEGASKGQSYIENCYNLASIYANDDGGGLVGSLDSAGEITLNITDCYNRGTLKAKGGKGGLVGYAYSNSTLNVTRCISRGEMFDLYNQHVDGSNGAGWVSHKFPGKLNLNNVVCDYDVLYYLYSYPWGGYAPTTNNNVTSYTATYFADGSVVSYLGGYSYLLYSGKTILKSFTNSTATNFTSRQL